MWKIRFLVKCGNYENILYFDTHKDAEIWAGSRDVKVISIEKVSMEKFAKDYICEL